MSTINSSAPALLTSVLTASQNGLLVYQAIRTGSKLTDLRLTMCNTVAERDMGRTAIEAVGLPFSRLFPHLAESGLLERYQRVIVNGLADRFEFEYTRPGQPKPMWCDVSVVPLMEDSLVVSYDNITQIKADAEAARRASALQQAFDASVNGITVFEAIRDTGSGAITDFRFVMINEAGLNMSGFTHDELLGHTLWEIYPATGINGLFSQYVAVCETGQPFTGDHYYPEYDTWREVSVVPVPTGVMVTYNDITARRKSEDAARQQTQFVENLLESIPAGMAVMNAIRDPDGRLIDFQVLRVNSVLQELFCLSPAQVLGRTLTVSFFGANASGLLSRSIASVELGEKQAFEMPFGSQERAGWYRVSMAPQGDQVILAVTDISHSRRTLLAQHLEAELLQSVLNASHDSIVAVDAVFDDAGVVKDFVYVMMNRAGENTINRRLEDIQGRGMLEVFPANRETGLFDFYRQVWETGQPQRVEKRYDADGVTGWFLVSIVRRGPGLLITVTDTTGLHQARHQAEQQAELLRSISDNTPAGLVLWEAVYDNSPDHQVIDFCYRMTNSMNAFVTGYPAEELIGQRLFDRFPRFRHTEMDTALRETLATGRTQRMVFTYYTERPDGWFDAQFIRVNPDTVLMTFMDVSEQHKAQINQKQQADTFKAILSHMLHGMTVLRVLRDETGQLADLQFEHVSEQVVYDTGLSRHQFIGSTMLTLFPGIRQSRIWQAYTQALETGEAQQFEEHYHFDGFDNHTNYQVARIDENRLVATYQIINELKAAQRKAEEQAQLLASIMNNITAGVALYDPVWTPAQNGQPAQLADLRFRLVNETGARVAGRPVAELTGQLYSVVLPSPEGQALRRQMIDVLEAGQPKDWLLPYFSDGIQGWFQVTMSVQQEQLLVTFSDVSELKRQQQALEVANMELRRSNDNLQQFAYVASHDLQEPLRKIQSFGSILATKYADVLDENGRDIIIRIQKAANRMSGLIQDLLNYSRISTERKPFEPLSLTQLLTTLVDDLSVAVQESGAVIDWDHLPVIVGDYTQLKQLFQNLLSNAVKFGVPGVPPRVSVTHRILASAALPSSVVGTALAVPTTDDGKAIDRFYEINVKDNGIGFDEEYLDRIFQVFQRLHSKNEYAGTGVGLAICRKVVENHRGAITASSQPGAGATFRVYLPVGVA